MADCDPIVGEAFGLPIVVDSPLPGLGRSDGTRSGRRAATGAAVRIRLGVAPPLSVQHHAAWQPWYESPSADDHGSPIVTSWRLASEGHFRILYADGFEFWIDPGGSNVWSTWPQDRTVEEAAIYLLGPIMGIVLRLRGVASLHASAIEIGGRAIALVGGARAGKSTTAAAFANAGYRILSDDITALRPGASCLMVESAFPQLKLWPPSVEALYGAADALPKLIPSDPAWDKRVRTLEDQREWGAEALPLGAVYLLGERLDAASAPSIERVTPRRGFLELVANTYVNYLLDCQMRRHEFGVLAQISERVPIRMVTPHADIRRVDALVDAIVGDVGRLDTASEPRIH